MRTIFLDKALTDVMSAIRDAAIAGELRPPEVEKLGGTGITAEWSRGWGVTARLRVSFRRLHSDEIYDDVSVEVGWSMIGGYSPSVARAAVVLHGQVTDLACAIEALLSNVEVKWEKKT